MSANPRRRVCQPRLVVAGLVAAIMLSAAGGCTPQLASETRLMPDPEPAAGVGLEPPAVKSPADSAAGMNRAGKPRVVVHTIRPATVTVHPDVNGRCAAWQAAHPDRSVWVGSAVNERAVPACMVNGVPTVARFCWLERYADGSGGIGNLPLPSLEEYRYCVRQLLLWLEEPVG